jgi:hypothetical protein
MSELKLRPPKESAARGRRDGSQLRRQSKPHILADQVQILLVRKTELRQALADLLDEHFRRGSSGGEADATDAFEPGRIDVSSGVNEARSDLQAFCELDETIAVGAVLRAHDEDEVHVLGDLLDSFLPILRCVTNVIAGRPDDFGKALAEAGDNLLGVVEAEGGLREEGKLIRILDHKSIDGRDGIDNQGAVRSFAGCADDFLVVLMADENDGAFFASEFERFEMNFGDEGAGGVDDAERALLGFIAHGGRDTMSAEDKDGAGRDFGDGLNEDGAAAAELLDDVGVVHNFMVDVNRSTVGFESQFDDVHGADNAGTETARTDAEKSFSLSLDSHQFPKLLNLQNSIIPKTPRRRMD